MTVAVPWNPSEGGISDLDSAITLPMRYGVVQAFESAQGLCQPGQKTIGLAVFGVSPQAA